MKKFKIGDTVIVTNYGATYGVSYNNSSRSVHFYKKFLNSPKFLSDKVNSFQFKTSWDLDRKTKWKIKHISECGDYAFLIDNANHSLDIKLDNDLIIIKTNIKLYKYILNNE